MKARIMEAWDGGAISHTRVSKAGKSDRLLAPYPRLFIMTATADEVFQRHVEAEDWDTGYIGRWFLMACAKEREDPYPTSDRSQPAWIAENLTVRAGITDVGECTGMDPEARALWYAWYQYNVNRVLPGIIAGVRTRVQTMIQKLCLILAGVYYHEMHTGDAWAIPASVLLPAILLGELYINSVRYIQSTSAFTEDQRLMRKARTILADLDSIPEPAFVQMMGLTLRRYEEIVQTLSKCQVLKRDSNLAGTGIVVTRV